MKSVIPCPICQLESYPFDMVDFNKACNDSPQRRVFPLSGKEIYYYRCSHCTFCFAPEICNWSKEQFSKEIYNDEYLKVDPDHTSHRPLHNANLLMNRFNHIDRIKHLDFGGGGWFIK